MAALRGRAAALGVFQANGYPCPTAREPDAAGVFLKFSRFNHSCKPNAHHAWRRGERWIFATHDIEKGKELTTHYVDLFMTSEEVSLFPKIMNITK